MGTNQRASIVMSDDEIADFVVKSRTGTLATVGPDGQPHLTAMWYAVVDGEIWLETKAKSQKAVNLKRDPRVSFLIEDGDTYDTLRGVSFEGVAEIVDDPDVSHRVGVSVFERYTGPYTDEMKPVRRADDEQAGLRAHCRPPRALMGSPQARDAAHAGGRIDRAGRAGDRRLVVCSLCSPDGIRTHATAVRGRRPRPLDDGARTDPSCQHSSPEKAHLIAGRAAILLGYQDSNLEWLNQNQLCCQLHHTPLAA